MRTLLLLLCFPLVAYAEDPPHIAAAKRRQQERIEAKVTSVRGPRIGEYYLELDFPKIRQFLTDDAKAMQVTSCLNGELDWGLSEQANEPTRIILEKSRRNTIPDESRFDGLFWVYRTLDTSKLRAAEWVDTDRMESIDGVECRIFATPTIAERRIVRAWLDPKRDYLPLRIAFEDEKGKVRIDLTLAFDRDNKVASWTRFQTIALGASGTSTETYTVESLKLGGAIPPERFDCVFPPGADVIDARGKKPRYYVVGPDGSFQNPPFCILPWLPLGWPQYVLAAVFAIAILAFVFGSMWMTAYIVAAIWKRIRRRRRLKRRAGEPTASGVGGKAQSRPPTADAVGSPE